MLSTHYTASFLQLLRRDRVIVQTWNEIDDAQYAVDGFPRGNGRYLMLHTNLIFENKSWFIWLNNPLKSNIEEEKLMARALRKGFC